MNPLKSIAVKYATTTYTAAVLRTRDYFILSPMKEIELTHFFINAPVMSFKFKIMIIIRV